MASTQAQDAAAATVQRTLQGVNSHASTSTTTPVSTTVATTSNTSDPATAPAPLSKRAQKRLAREQEWEARKPLIKARRKEKDRLAKEARRKARLAHLGTEADVDGGGDDVREGQDGQATPEKRSRQDSDSVDAPSSAFRPNSGSKRRTRGRPDSSTVFGSSLVIDLGFDSLMLDKEIKSLASQLVFVHHANRSATAPFQRIILVGGGEPSTYATSSSGNQQSNATLPVRGTEGADAFSTSPTGVHLHARTNGTYRNWRNVHVIERGGLPALWNEDTGASPPWYKREDVVYLTADSDTVLEQLEEGKAYVLGGIVDKNRHKSICLNKAKALGIPTAQLPISSALFEPSSDEDGDEDAPPSSPSSAQQKQKQRPPPPPQPKMRTRKVLTVNQVVDILVGWTHERAAALAASRPPQAVLANLPTSASASAASPGPVGLDELGTRSNGVPAEVVDSGPALDAGPIATETPVPQPEVSLDPQAWWRAAVRRAFPQRKLKERTTPRRRRRNLEDAARSTARYVPAMGADAGEEVEMADEADGDNRGTTTELPRTIIEEMDDDDVYNERLQVDNANGKE